MNSQFNADIAASNMLQLYSNVVIPKNPSLLLLKSGSRYTCRYCIKNENSWKVESINRVEVTSLISPRSVYLVIEKENGEHDIKWFGKLTKELKEMPLTDLRCYLNSLIDKEFIKETTIVLGHEYFDHMIDKKGKFNLTLLSYYLGVLQSLSK